MFINEKITIIPTSRNKKWYLEKGYPEVPYLSPLEIESKDISHHSKVMVHWKCDYCGEIQESKAVTYFTQQSLFTISLSYVKYIKALLS